MDELIPSGDPDLSLYIALTLLGFLVGAIGHLYRSTPVIVCGIVLILLATIIVPLIVYGGGG